jgi:hypothetical protein
MSKYDYTKKLTFRAVNLGKDATLVLTFDQEVDGLFTDKYPVVWKTIKLPKIGRPPIKIHYVLILMSAPSRYIYHECHISQRAWLH